MNKSVICLMGPTASGKTDLAIALAEKLPIDIISVDSSMVYHSMDIGTAKPTPAELQKAPHQLIDIREPNEPYSAADFCKDAKKSIEQSFKQDRIPLLVGGTMLYFRSLQKGLSNLPAADPKIRKKLLLRIHTEGLETLHEELKKIDPASAKRIHPNDPQRLQRALEVFYTTGKPLSGHFAENHTANKYHFINIGLMPQDRVWLHGRIAERFKKMLASGFIDEVKSLLNKNFSVDLPALRAVGYRQACQYLSGEFSYDEFVEKGIIATRQLAKRQMTWLRSWPDIQLFDPQPLCFSQNIVEYIKNFV